jgi:hypothetical protein
MKVVKLLTILLLFSGCAHSIHQVHTSDFHPGTPIESGEMVKAKSEQFVIFGFVGQTNYVDEAYTKLMASCEGGMLTGITTQYSTSLGFFSWTNKILMQGLCVHPGQHKS